MSTFQEVLDLSLSIESRVYECYTGVIGLATDGDGSDCTWRRYQPNLPLWDVSFVNRGDSTRDYLSWTCSDAS